VQSTPRAGDTSADPAHLLALLEKQPCSILRVGIDGRLLAANESALGLLGSSDLAQLLGRNLTERILPAHRERWRAFLVQVWEVGSGSVECDLTDVSGVRRTLLLQGVALREHPDGNQSMLVGARDTLASRVTFDDLRVEIDHARAEHQRLATLLAVGGAEHQRLTTLLAESDAERQRQAVLLADHQLALLLQEGEQRQMVDAAHRETEQKLAERQSLEAELDERNRELQQLVVERVAERAEAEHGLAEAASRERQIAKVLADHRVELRSLDEAVRILESLAAGGRMAREVGRELQAAVGAVDARAKSLLALSALDASERHEIETLRSEALHAASLVRQIVHANAEGVMSDAQVPRAIADADRLAVPEKEM
jgi:PAS domain-containing protein